MWKPIDRDVLRLKKIFMTTSLLKAILSDGVICDFNEKMVVTGGLPEGAILTEIGSERNGIVSLVFWHESFDLVNEWEEIPVLSPRTEIWKKDAV